MKEPAKAMIRNKDLSLEEMSYRIEAPEAIRTKAKAAIDKMLAVT